MILKKMELLSINCISQTIIVINWRQRQSGSGRQELVGAQLPGTTCFVDSRILLLSWGSQIKEILIHEFPSS